MIPSRPRISVGVPVRNGERFLQEALDSLLAQSYQNFELIISDNASTDRTQSICREYAARDPRVRYYRSEQDMGLANNFNCLFIRARGDYFKWAAADDVHEPDWISNCLAVLEQDPSVVLVYGKTRFIDQNGALVEETDPGFDLRFDAAVDRLRYVVSATSWVNAIFGLIRTHELAKTRLFPSYPGGDYPLLAELAVLGKFVEVPDLLFRRRLHPGASSQNIGNSGFMVRLWTAGGRRSSPAWSRSRDDFRTILNSGLSGRQKLSLEMSLLRAMIRARQRLWAELQRGLFSRS